MQCIDIVLDELKQFYKKEYDIDVWFKQLFHVAPDQQHFGEFGARIHNPSMKFNTLVEVAENSKVWDNVH